jgi:chromosome segregation ATPase
MNDPAMGAGIWLDTVLHRLRHAAGNRAAQLSDAAAMTDEERQRFSRRLREANAEIERLRAALQTVREENNRAKRQFTNVSNKILDDACRELEPKP